MIGWAVLLGLVAVSRAEMEGFVVGGGFASILKFPHSSFLSITCAKSDQRKAFWMCGASVVNQKILLTAAHCVEGCLPGTNIVARFGVETSREGGVLRSASSFIMHEKYNSIASYYDIGLIKLYKPLKFNSRIRRVALMKRPPYRERAELAGWGLVDELKKEEAVKLKHVVQKVWKQVDCEKKFSGLPKGTICASAPMTVGYAAAGDSGSALVVRDYIQIGLVSYKVPGVAANVIVYTDTGYFYDWIHYNALRLYCTED